MGDGTEPVVGADLGPGGLMVLTAKSLLMRPECGTGPAARSESAAADRGPFLHHSQASVYLHQAQAPHKARNLFRKMQPRLLLGDEKEQTDCQGL